MEGAQQLPQTLELFIKVTQFAAQQDALNSDSMEEMPVLRPGELSIKMNPGKKMKRKV